MSHAHTACAPKPATGPRRWAAVLLGMLVASGLGLGGGCHSDGATRSDADTVPAEPLPTYEDLRAAHVQRTRGLDRLWTRLVAKLEAERLEDLPGGEVARERIAEQLDGHLQIVQPGKAAINLGRLGDVFLYLGSDGDRSWLLDLLDNTRRSGVVYPARGGVAVFGDWIIAIDASDLAFLLGVEPWPELDELLAPGSLDSVDVGWVPLDTVGIEGGGWGIGVTFPSAGGTHRVVLDPGSHEPLATEIIRAIGAEDQALRVLARLGPMQTVDVRGVADADLSSPPRIPTTVDVDAFGPDGEPTGLRARMWLNGPRARRIRPENFDLGALLDRFGVPAERVQGLESNERDAQGSGSFIGPPGDS